MLATKVLLEVCTTKLRRLFTRQLFLEVHVVFREIRSGGRFPVVRNTPGRGRSNQGRTSGDRQLYNLQGLFPVVGLKNNNLFSFLIREFRN